jgi:ABC-2 type transport system permease protein
MRRPWLIAQREFLENVRTKSFWIGIFVLPLILTLSVVLPAVLEKTRKPRPFAVLDHSGWVLDAIRPKLAEGAKRFSLITRTPAPDDPAAEDSLNRLVRDEDLFAYFVIGPDPIGGSSGSLYLSRNLTDSDLREWFGEHVTAAVRARRLEREQIDPVVAAWIQEPLRFELRKVTAAGEAAEVTAQDRLRQWAPLIFVYLLWISVFSISQMLLTNTVEEKSNRIIEVLLSSVSPVELMAGKIAGIAQTGFTIIVAWLLSFFVITKYVPGWIGVPSTLDLSVLTNDPVYLTSFVAYFLLGYLLFAAMLVGIGAVCNTLKEAQNLMGPITILLILPLLAMVPIGKDPNGALAKVLSFIPPFTPFVMMNRAAGPPAPWEYVATTALLLVSIAVSLWAAAKVFRIGVLLTGKPPKLGEILRWIRAPVGVVVVRRES